MVYDFNYDLYYDTRDIFEMWLEENQGEIDKDIEAIAGRIHDPYLEYRAWDNILMQLTDKNYFRGDLETVEATKIIVEAANDILDIFKNLD